MRQQLENTEIDNVNRYREQLSNFNTDFDLGLFLYILKKNILWIVLFIGLSLLGSFLYIRYTAPTYQSSSIIQIEKSNTANQILNVDNYYEIGDISAEIELLRSNLIAKNSISILPLEVSYFNQGQFLDFELYRTAPFRINVYEKDSTAGSIKVYIDFKNEANGTIRWGGKKNPISKDIQFGKFVKLPFGTIKVSVINFNLIKENRSEVKPQEYYFIINDLNVLARQLMSNIGVTVVNPSAKTISISVKDNNKLKAKEVVEVLIQEFKKYNEERKRQSSKQIVQFLNEQIASVYEDQKKSEKEMQSFKRKNNLGYRRQGITS